MRCIEDGDVFEFEGYSFQVMLEGDDTSEAPWEESDMHGVVTDWVRRPKRPWERILNRSAGSFRYYDFRASVERARTVWGCSDPDAAARADFERLRDWCRDHWQYIGVIVVPLDSDGDPIMGCEQSLWHIESDAGEYLTEVAHELARECMGSLPREVMP